MSALFEIELEWEPLYGSLGTCRDCGTKCGGNQGGASDGRLFEVCDGCASLDRCMPLTSRDGWHRSRWGITHPESEHDGLVDAQTKRRSRYLKAVPS